MLLKLFFVILVLPSQLSRFLFEAAYLCLIYKYK